MLHIKRFIDKVSHIEGTKTKDVVLPIAEAKGLRDDIAKLLLQLNEANGNSKDEVIKVQITGGSFK